MVRWRTATGDQGVCVWQIGALGYGFGLNAQSHVSYPSELERWWSKSGRASGCGDVSSVRATVGASASLARVGGAGPLIVDVHPEGVRGRDRWWMVHIGIEVLGSSPAFKRGCGEESREGEKKGTSGVLRPTCQPQL